MSDDEFLAGYSDGGDPDAPEPSANRSHAYRHSFAVRRAELAARAGRGSVIPAAKARELAAEALRKDETA